MDILAGLDAARSMALSLHARLEAEAGRLAAAEQALMAYCGVPCAFHSFDVATNVHRSLASVGTSVAELLATLHGHHVAKYPREGNQAAWRALPLASTGRRYIWQLLLPPVLQDGALQVTIVLESEGLEEIFSPGEQARPRLAALSPDHWWACVCRPEDLASCREALSAGLCCGRASEASSSDEEKASTR